MLNGYKKSERTLVVKKVRRKINKLKDELHEYRYHFERNVEKRMEHLATRIAELESCNAELCDKLAYMEREREQ